MAESSGDGRGARAAHDIDRQFQENRRNLILEHRRQEQRMLTHHKAQLQSFVQNRETAELRHAQSIRNLDGQQEREAVALDRQHGSFRGKLAAMTKAGRMRQNEQRDALATKFDNLRMREHRGLEALKERQFRAEMADRVARAREMKLFRQDHGDARRQQERTHQQNRPRQIEERSQTQQRAAAEQALKQGLQELQHGRGRTIAR